MADRRTRTASLAGLYCVLLFAAAEARASTLEITIKDRDGEPVVGAAVFWRPPAGKERVASAGTTSVMDQVDTRFVPHILIVQAGTSVEFPNSDTVAHHVYSFSHPNQFKLPIYKGDAHPPVTFSDSGIVILGCNIHDNMLGYILVVDSASFGKTDAQGKLHMETGLDGGDIVIWSPRFRDSEDVMVRSLSDGDTQINFQLSKPLRPAFDEKTDALSWSDY